MIISFTTSFTTYKIAALAEIGVEGEDKGYMVYLKAIKEAQGSDPMKYLKENLLKKFPKTTSYNVITELQALQLVDEYGKITSVGEDALQTETIYFPSRGIFNFEFVKNTPMKSSVIDITENRSKLIKEVNVSDEIDIDQGQRFKLLDGRNIVVLSLEEKGQKVKENSTRSKIVCEFVHDGGWSLWVRTNSNDKIKVELSDEFIQLNIHERIFEYYKKNPYDDDSILVKFDELNEKELQTFKGNRVVKDLKIPEYNLSVNLQIEDIKLFPANSQEAIKWALKLFTSNYMGSYLTQSECVNLWQEMVKEIPEFQVYPDLYNISFETMLKEILDTSKSKFLVAPIDFRLEGLV